jgi:hypothetical protein
MQSLDKIKSINQSLFRAFFKIRGWVDFIPTQMGNRAIISQKITPDMFLTDQN